MSETKWGKGLGWGMIKGSSTDHFFIEPSTRAVCGLETTHGRLRLEPQQTCLPCGNCQRVLRARKKKAAFRVVDDG